MRDKLIELLLNSTVHAVPNMLRTKSSFLKIMCLVFFFSSTYACIYYTLDSIADFLKYKTVTSINIVNENQPQFPAISFCAYPPFEKPIDDYLLNIKFENRDVTNLSEVLWNLIVVFSVYCKDLKYTHISQEAKAEIFNLVSNIGGIMGVFLGISFLSFIELIEIFFELILNYFRKNK